MEGVQPGGVVALLPMIYPHEQARIDVPIYLVAACAYCRGPTFSPFCSWCGNHVCSGCGDAHWRCCLGCSTCGAVAAPAGSCRLCGLALCDSCIGTHVCAPQGSNNDFGDSPREGSHPSSLEEDICVEKVAGTGGCDESREWDEFDRVSGAWDVGGAVQLQHNLTVRMGRVAVQVSSDDDDVFGASVNDFRRLADQLAWDFPSGVVTVHLDRKKALVFVPGRETNACALSTALSWAKHFAALTIAIRTRAGKIEFSVLDVMWFPGQSSRLPFFQGRFLSAVRALGVE